MAQEGCTDLICAGFLDMSNYPKDGYSLILNESNKNKLVSTFKLSNFSNTKNIFDYEIKKLNGSDFNTLSSVGAYSGVTPDGMFLAFAPAAPVIIFDVNGQKGPNVAGRDIHSIYIIDNMVTPMYSHPYLRFLGFTVSDDSLFNQNYLITVFERNCSPERNDDSPMLYCLERIILDGWEMKY